MKACLLALNLVFFAVLSSNVAAETTSRSVVGNWAGTYDGEVIELSVWFDAEPLEFGYARGYLLNHTRNCGIGFIGEHTMSPSTTFLGYLANSELANHSIELELRNTAAGAFTLCAPLAPTHGRLLFAYHASERQTSLYTADMAASTAGRTVLEKLTSLQRQRPTSMMQSVFAANPDIDRERGAAARPGPGVKLLMDNPSLDPETTVTYKELPCRVHLRDQQVRMRAMGISELAGSLESASQIGVRYQQLDEEDEQYASIAADSISQPDFLAMSSGKQGLRFGPDACKQATAVSGFLAALEGGASSGPTTVAASGSPRPRLDDVEGLYFFDAAGIDQVRRHDMVRVFGTTTVFVPGDTSREGQWSPQTQSMKMRAMVKNSGSGLIEKDLLSRYNEARFAYDTELSQQLGGDIWTTVSDPRDGGICLRWREVHYNDNCIERSTASMHTEHRYYIAKDLAIAKKIFAEISPDAITLSAAELADPMRRCADGPYCDMPGGLYLNAIYEGNFALLQTLDALIKNARVAKLRGNRPAVMAGKVDVVDTLIDIAIEDSMLPGLANRYMYRYQELPESCLLPGHDTVHKEEMDYARYLPQPDYNGIPQPDMKIGEDRLLTSEYTMNQNFLPLCTQLCSVAVPKDPTAFASEMGRTLGQGLDKIQFDGDCNSAMTKQFEKGLIDVTIKSLTAPPAAVYAERSSL